MGIINNTLSNKHVPDLVTNQRKKAFEYSEPEQNTIKSQAAYANPQVSTNSQVATKVIYQSISRNVLNGEHQQENIQTDQDDNTHKGFDSQLVADSVMKFVKGSLFAAKQRGASDDDLNLMFEQAKSGINQGFLEAIDELKGLNLFNNDLENGIEHSKSLIDGAMDEFHQHLFPKNIEENELSEQYANNLDVLEKSMLQASISSYQSQANSADLIIETADGDVIEISFSHSYLSTQNQGFAKNSTSSIAPYNASASEQLNFTLSISGNLDKEERAAIESFMTDVNSLQKDFFAGNLDQAFEKALTLGFDSNELVGFSLDLQKSQTSVVNQKYFTIANDNDKHSVLQDKELRPILDFIEQINLLHEKSTQLFNRDNVFGDILTKAFKLEDASIDPKRGFLKELVQNTYNE